MLQNDIINDSHPQIYTVTELNAQTRQLLEQHFSNAWVSGEISNVSHPSSGHVYFTLKDKGAQVRCALFRMNRRRIAFPIENGIQVNAYAKVSLYEPRGDYQLIVTSLEEAGDGLLQRQYEMLKKRLEAEGLFEAVHKKPLPQSPQTVGVITSATGAAIRDVIRVFARRSPNTKLIIYPTQVQGHTAAASLTTAVKLATARNECDALLITRGGGSLEDLFCFNDETLARAIFDCPMPTISAVGHEVDFTISDFVADHRAATPSAGAEILSQDQTAHQATLQHYRERLILRMRLLIQEKQHHLAQWQTRLPNPVQHLRESAQLCDQLEIRLKQGIAQRLKTHNTRFSHLCVTLNALSPLNTLGRGYAIVRNATSRDVISSPSDCPPNTKINIQFKTGTLTATTTEP
jgi:exodeoxyribonuclease VII large subunit